MGRRRGRSRCGLKIESRGTHDLVYPRNHVRGNENKSVVTGQPCVIFSRRNDRPPPPPSAPPSSISLIRGNSIRPSGLYGLEGRGRVWKEIRWRAVEFIRVIGKGGRRRKGRMMRLLGRRRNDDVLDSDATSPPYLTRQFLFESYFPTLAFEYSSCNSAGSGVK